MSIRQNSRELARINSVISTANREWNGGTAAGVTTAQACRRSPTTSCLVSRFPRVAVAGGAHVLG